MDDKLLASNLGAADSCLVQLHKLCQQCRDLANASLLATVGEIDAASNTNAPSRCQYIPHGTVAQLRTSFSVACHICSFIWFSIGHKAEGLYGDAAIVLIDIEESTDFMTELLVATITAHIVGFSCTLNVWIIDGEAKTISHVQEEC